MYASRAPLLCRPQVCPRDQVTSSTDCFAAVATAGVNGTSFKNATVADAAQPSGCSVTVNSDGTATATFNTSGKGACPTGSLRSGAATSPIDVSLGLHLDSTVAGALATIVRAHES